MNIGSCCLKKWKAIYTVHSKQVYVNGGINGKSTHQN